jgi:UDP-3-O-[3-hydroxymyristoyl] glucosamine N-acyltransferase LpxD
MELFELADVAKVKLPPVWQNKVLQQFKALTYAQSGDCCFYVDTALNRKALQQAPPGVILFAASLPDQGDVSKFAWLIADDAVTLFFKLLAAWRKLEQQHLISSSNEDVEVHPTAIVEGRVGKGSRIGPYSVIPAGVSLGECTTVEAHCVFYGGVTAGNHCYFQSGCIIGGRGFGYFEVGGKKQPYPHLGGVLLDHHVFVGSLTTIVSGTVSPTLVGEGTQIDAHCHVAHNCFLGKNVFMSGHSALAGSVILDDNSILAGAAKIADHLRIGKKSVVAANSGVTKNVPDGQVYGGYPAMEITKWRKLIARTRNQFL